ncbi:MAG: helix-turn-helix transcriptional regulator [Phycisphaerae bacterium]|nr:MAG: hypothetical protein EDS66_08180 [Planctomycetota bacterium]KAB2950245.1 MAG: BlaI/MecI/CopY family transcriptional regulator [Phycisphaerae bacterium]MBE7456147.1 helix-turn-helix transcriptional regulator [Planctomycetia bacterium]MCK6465435.1 BlaI/MecI/CopY family transcriptional regulator [Phycisphaerae bacterium]MCL4718548.1 helix-turn-helix transcriptional regulator [Phycisphaerae bacterium]
MSKRGSSELECFVLGLVWQLGPISAYDVRAHMRRSPSTQWSGSAGAIYPLMSRLHRRHWLAATRESVGRRRRTRYRITAAGRRALRAWIGPPFSPDVMTVSYDPLRSRARFLGALSPRERQRWIQGAEAALHHIEALIRTWHDEHARGSDGFRALLTIHGQLETRARRAWLRRVAEFVAS